MDDTLDAFGLHGMGGIAGAILTGVFAAPWSCVQPVAFDENGGRGGGFDSAGNLFGVGLKGKPREIHEVLLNYPLL